MEKIIPTPEIESQTQVQSPSTESIAVEPPTVAEVVVETPDPADTPKEEKTIYPLPPTKRAKWLRNIAGVLLVAGIILNSTSFLFSGIFSNLVSPGVFFSLGYLLPIFGILFLLFIPTNLPTRIALSISIIVDIVSAHLMPILTQSLITPILIIVILGLVYVFLISLIAQNNRLSVKESGWLHIIFLLFLFWRLPLIAGCFAPEELLIQNIYPQDFVFTMIIWPIFRIIAWWKFTRLALFNGHIDTTLKANYSPLNRYMLGAVVAIIVATLGMWLIYGNANWILSLI